MKTLWIPLLAASAALANPSKAEVSKPLTTVVNAVRYGKDDLALKQFAGEEQGKALLGENWAKATDEQRKEFVRLFHALFAKIAFPKFRANFEHLDTLLYEDPKGDGGKAEIVSVILINHPMKKQEIKVRYALTKDKAGWKVVDVTVLGTLAKSMLTDIREQQVGPIFAEGGFEHLLKLMRERAKEAGVTLK